MEMHLHLLAVICCLILLITVVYLFLKLVKVTSRMRYYRQQALKHNALNKIKKVQAWWLRKK